MKSTALKLALFALVAIFSLPFLALYIAVLVVIGGGWAYVGADSCYFVLNPLGYAMIVVPVGVVIWRLRKPTLI
ncbi:MAG TPA: hypothetical protein VJT15_22470 [Pyrinomonadaceae bacterium]|nr:hypothetical protein [Pyrinomonadaceae bacterium]